MIRPGLFIIAGATITHEYDCTTLLLRLSNDQYVLIGTGSGEYPYTLLRNIIELGISIVNIRYVIIPYPARCIAGGCCTLKEMFPWIHIVSHPSFARMLRNGIDMQGKYTYPPCPVSYVTDSVNIGETELTIDPLERCTGTLIKIVRKQRQDLKLLIIEDVKACQETIVTQHDAIVCLAEEPVCIQAHHDHSSIVG